MDNDWISVTDALPVVDENMFSDNVHILLNKKTKAIGYHDAYQQIWWRVFLKDTTPSVQVTPTHWKPIVCR